MVLCRQGRYLDFDALCSCGLGQLNRMFQILELQATI